MHKKNTSKPTIAIVCCHKIVDDDCAQVVKNKYIDAVIKFGGMPVLLPAMLTNNMEAFTELLKNFDGFLLTGSYSNVNPIHYGGNHIETYTDDGRDKLSFAIIDFAKTHHVPLLAICRGHQEVNVAYGGSLHPDYRAAGYTETHLYPSELPKEHEYQPIHDIHFKNQPILDAFKNQPILDAFQNQQGDKWAVNSLHNQCINTLGKNLTTIATATDGLIEAITDINHPFMIGVQWHPEGCVEDKLSEFLFSQFIRACLEFKN